MKRSRRASLQSALILVAASLLSAQPRPRFEVASVRPNRGVATGTGDVRPLPGGRLNAENAVLYYLIQAAYGVKPYQISGAPEWSRTERFDIDAKAAGNAGPEQLRLMLQSLLEDRFQLRVRHETKVLPLYELSLARGADKLQAAKLAACLATDPNAPLPPPAPGETPRLPCGRIGMRITPSFVRMEGASVSVADLAQRLSFLLGRTVADQTDFTGMFDVHLQFAHDQALAGLPDLVGAAEPPKPPPDGDSATDPSVFAALQEQLGLKLAATHAPVDLLIIENVQRLSAN
jgi:uncharacterized protein (TIGR03435 family)